MTFRHRFSRQTWIKICHSSASTLHRDFGLGFSLISGVWRLGAFWMEFLRHRRLVRGSSFRCDARDAIPCLRDRTATTPIEPVYFVQDTWFAGRIAQRSPDHHVDVGSSAKTMALVAQFIPVTMVDIRAVPISVDGFTFLRGSILDLPFADGTIPSLSSLCVVEHIGLGRYGDPPDPFGSEKSIRELMRVLAPGGSLYLSIPVDSENKIYFNAHRAFTRARILELCENLEIVDEQYLYGFEVVRQFAPDRGFGTGMYHFRKS